MFFGRNDAKAETPVLWPPHAKSWLIEKRLWCWEGLVAGGEGDNRRWDGWMASLSRWMWVWVNSGSWWTGRPGVLGFMGSQIVRHDWVTELNWEDFVTLKLKLRPYFIYIFWYVFNKRISTHSNVNQYDFQGKITNKVSKCFCCYGGTYSNIYKWIMVSMMISFMCQLSFVMAPCCLIKY